MSESLPPETVTEESAPAKRSPWLYVAIGVIGVFVIILALSLLRTKISRSPRPAPRRIYTLKLFPGFEGNAGMNPVKLSDLKGKIVVLNFWASWCIPCADEAEDLQAVYERYKDQGVVFLGVDLTDIEGDALNYLKRFGITFANGPDLGTEIGPLW